MTMRGLIWFVLLFAAAAALALVGVFDGGQVLLVMPPYRVDVSLNLFVVALIVSFIVIYAVLRAVMMWLVGIHGLKQRVLWKRMPLIPLWDATAFLLWVASFTRRSIRWRGGDYHIRDGELVPVISAQSEK